MASDYYVKSVQLKDGGRLPLLFATNSPYPVSLVSFIEHPSFVGAMSSFHLGRLLAGRNDLRRQALQAFRASSSYRR